MHLNSLHLPILHDPFYPMVQHKADDDFSQPLQLLAKELYFNDPITQQNFHFILCHFDPIVNFAVQKSGRHPAIFKEHACYLM